MSMTDAALLFLVCLAAAGASVIAALVLQRSALSRRPGLFSDPGRGAVFLFDGTRLLDATASARALLAATPALDGPWASFLAWAVPRFPGVEQGLAGLAQTGQLHLASRTNDGTTLTAEWLSGVLRIAVIEAHDTALPMIDSLLRKAQEEELQALQNMMDKAPLPIWREDDQTRVTWANQKYVDLVTRLHPRVMAPSWPLPQLLPTGPQGRHALTLAGTESPLWFDLIKVATTGGLIGYALPANSAVEAEQSRDQFVQTLAQSFANLPTGLAIFDNKRRMQLFNPALTDLTRLSPEFLSASPTLYAFLDALRENGQVPEPRDYKAWRAHIAAVERSADDEGYEETWVISPDMTWRVTGRPQPQGALALMIEDISEEITRARRLRSDLELGQAVIDTMSEAVTVFSDSGRLLMSNTSYARLWDHDPAHSIQDATFSDFLTFWEAATAPDPLWAQVRAYVNSIGPREQHLGKLRLLDGRALGCRMVPLSGGATLIGFSQASAMAQDGSASPAVVPPMARASPLRD